MSRLPLQAVLFDMDGTLVDTERLWWEAVEQVAARPLTEADRPDVLGRPVEHTAAWLAAATGTPAAALAETLHREFADRVRTGVVPRPGALDLLDALARERIPTALVTASPRAVADTVLAALGASRFAVSVTADDTEHTKPAPDPYLAACRALGVQPSGCVAVEDTETGVRSAEAAGCAVLAVPSLAPIEAAPGRTVLTGLEDVTVTRLRALLPYRLRVMTWNLWYGGTKVHDHRAKQLKVIAETDVDVVGLQETYGTAAEELARALGWHHHSAGPNLGVISRFPITAAPGDPDVGFYGAAGARITVGEREVEIWTAHLDSARNGPYEEEPLAHEEVRLGQLRDTLRRIGDAAPVVLVGDFNCPSHLDRPGVEWRGDEGGRGGGFPGLLPGGPPGPRARSRAHLVAGARPPGAAGPDRLRPAPRTARARLADVRQRHAPDLAGCRGQRLAVRPCRGDHHILTGQRARDCLASMP
ncbi:HAD superfamily hydrolase (TIGR01509 family) [Streptomyces canus]